MRSIILVVLVSLMSVGCAVQDDAPATAPQVSYTEMQLVDSGTLDVASGTIIVDSNDVVRGVHIDLFDSVSVVMGLEPTDDGATDWIFMWVYEGELYTVRTAGHVDVTLSGGCAELWVSSDVLSGSATFCAN